MMKRIVSFILIAACALSLVMLSVFAASIEAAAPTAAEVETTVVPTISEDYIPSGTPHQYNIVVDNTKAELQANLIICEYEKPTTKQQALNNKSAVKEYLTMLYELLPPQHQSNYGELYLMAYPSFKSSYDAIALYDKDIAAFEEEEKKVEAKKKAEANKKAEEKKKQEQQQNQNTNTSGMKYLGKFKLTAYCNCKKCCGKWSGGPTASGKMPKAGRTIAVDPKVIPLGSKVVINGKTYTAEDTGSAIKNKRIDVYFNSHQAALNFGVQYAEVYICN